MLQKKYLLLNVTLLVILIISFSSYEIYSAEKKISDAVQLELDTGNNQIEILIYLTRQLNTARIAAEASSRASNMKQPVQTKKEVRAAVDEALQKNAKFSQEPLLKYLENKASQGKVKEVDSYYIVNMIYASVKPEIIPDIAARQDVKHIYLNKEVTLEKPIIEEDFFIQESEDISWNIKHIGAPEVWDIYGITGEGIVIGIIDTGVDWEHPALKQSWRGYDQGVTDSAYNWYDFINSSLLPEDDHGHGTSVISIAVGKDQDSNKQVGVAPGAKWIAVKGLNSSGSGRKLNLLKAGQFMLAPTDSEGNNPNPDMAPDIIINSWGGPLGDDDWYWEMVENWRNANILPVFAAGNSGPQQGSINNPANYPGSIAAGAVNRENELADFSSRGPGVFGDIFKPDLVAPGVGVLIAKIGNSYDYVNGTSMATPHIAGSAALLLSLDPAADLVELEKTLKTTATTLTDQAYPSSPNYGYGYGLVNPMLAIESMLYKHYILTVKVEGKGRIIPGGAGLFVHPAGKEVTINAVPALCWNFEKWVVNGETIEENVISIAIEEDIKATAYFIERYDPENWSVIESPGFPVALDQSWLISFNRAFKVNEIDGIVIEHNGRFIPLDIELKHEQGKILITPIGPYLPAEEYLMKIFLNTQKRYKMYFETAGY